MWHSLKHPPHHSFLRRLPVESGSKPSRSPSCVADRPPPAGMSLCGGSGPATRADAAGLCLLRPLARTPCCPAVVHVVRVLLLNLVVSGGGGAL